MYLITAQTHTPTPTLTLRIYARVGALPRRLRRDRGVPAVGPAPEVARVGAGPVVVHAQSPSVQPRRLGCLRSAGEDLASLAACC